MSQQQDTPAVKTCSRCGELKPRERFGRRRARDGLSSYCKDCAAAYQREYRRREPERFREYERKRLEQHGDKRRDRDRQRWPERSAEQNRRRFARKVQARYSLSLDEYDAAINAPCQICGGTEDMVLDHCHATKVIRGPLCRWCNLGLGYFKDDSARLRAAADYIDQHRKEVNAS